MATGNAPRGFPRILQWLLAGLMLIIGLAVGILGAKLALVGGTLYFALMGVVMVIAAVLIFRNRRGGILLYAVAFIASVIWAISDAGWNYWPLFSRLFALGVLAFLAALVWPFLASPPAKKGPAYGVAAVLAVALAVSFGWMFKSAPLVSATEAVPVKPVAPGEQQKNWAHWGNTTHGDRFAALDQINKQNVNQLQVAWVAHTGDIPQSNGSGAEDQNTPLQIGDTLYVCTPYSKVLALDVDSGKEKWRYDSKSSSPNWQRCRGLGYYADSQAQTAQASGTQPAACSRRLFLPTIDARLIAIDADTGKLCESFGDRGIVDLSVGMGEVKAGYYQQTSTPLVAGNVVVVGGRVADNYSTGEPPGVVRAFDVHTGKLAWAWDPGNPALTGVPPEGQTYTRGTPNVWSAMSYDAKLNLIYLPTGNATPDFFGGERTALDDKYSSSIVAVDATTGQVRWHFQTTHHDLWDFDLPSQPLLYDLPDGKGGTTPVLVQTSKQGMIFMLNRETGEPVAKVEERPVPAGNVKGERYSPTQPYSVGMPMIGNQTLTESDMWGATPIDLLLCRIQFKEMRHQGVFTPPFPAVPGLARRHELGQCFAGSKQQPDVCQRYASGPGQLYGAAREGGERRQRDRDGHRADGGHAVWRDARTFPVAAGHSVPEAAVRHHVRGRSENRETGVAGASWHRRRHRAAGHTYAHANSNRHADPWRIAGNAVRTAVLRRHPGFLPARL